MGRSEGAPGAGRTERLGQEVGGWGVVGRGGESRQQPCDHVGLQAAQSLGFIQNKVAVPGWV